MTAPQLYLEAARRGLRLEPRGANLAVIPGNRVPADFEHVLRDHKAELLNWLSQAPCAGWQSVPPDDLPLNPIMPRPAPHDRERMIAYMVRQGCDHPNPLTAWLVKRENAYFEGSGRLWDCAIHAYAAARDAACWQLNCNENDVYLFFEATAEAVQVSQGTQ